MKLCSACLLGAKCAYDGEGNLSKKVLGLLKDEILIPVCPEVFGGLNVPREPSEIQGGNGREVLEEKARVVMKNGRDVTQNFLEGAKKALKIARVFNIDKAILKQRSPSCGKEDSITFSQTI